MTEVISVRFRSGCKNYYFDPKGQQVKMGEQVVVETAQGPEFATCTETNHEVPEESIVKPLCAVLRKATDADRRTVEYNRKRESEAFDTCEKRIGDLGLEMKLVNVSASFDGSKIIFFFTADGRVDFRELVRDLASVFRARIELRQIGVRDEAKMVGGLGICGRPFCCSQFLDSFMPVSIKMAKTQNLSLNPTKISGTCGRLMCCLKYEQNAYEDAQKRMPKAESFVQTPDGPGNVKSIDLLRETMKVSLDSAPSPLKCYHGCEVCVLRNGKGSRDGIEVPAQRPIRYVEEKEHESYEPVIGTPFLMSEEFENAPLREKFGAGEDNKPKRRRKPRRRSGEPGSEQRYGEQKSAEQKSGEQKPTEQKPTEQKPAERKPVERKPVERKPAERKPAAASEKKQLPRTPKPPRQPQAEQKPPAAVGDADEAQRRRRPRHRGGRRHHGENGAPPKAE